MLSTSQELNVSTILNNDAALTPTAGDKLYAYISEPLSKKQSVILDFEGIRFITSAFLNASIGQLYAHFSNDFVKEHLSVTHLENDDLILLARVVERAKEYFLDKDSMEAALGKIINE